MQFKGKVIYAGSIQMIQLSNGKTMRKREAVIQSNEKYPQTLLIEILNDNVENAYINEDQEVVVDFNSKAQQYKDKWYQHNICWKIEVIMPNDMTRND